jgi:hypothetical protein
LPEAIMPNEFKPVLYLKKGCPFCFKLRLFLLEAGLLDRFTIREFAEGTEEENSIRAELSPLFDKLSFPAAQIAPGKYMQDSEALVSRYADEAGIDPAKLLTFQAYVEGPFRTILSLFKENRELKRRAA